MKEEELQVYKDHIREGLVKYTRKAFRMLPQLDKPRILDMGCGSGIPTLELARLSQGEVIGIDTDQPALDRLTTKIREAGLTGRVKALNRSMFDMDFPDASFDVIWSEGSIYVIGFERGLREWKRLLNLEEHIPMTLEFSKNSANAKRSWICLRSILNVIARCTLL